MVSSETSKDTVRKVFFGDKVAWVPFMPWVCIHAARLEQISLREMLSEPSLLARALENAQKLYGYDVIVNVFDPTIEAEACGCPIKWTSETELPVLEDHLPIDNLSEGDIANIKNKGRLPVVLEATKRIKATLGRTLAVAGVLTGPFTLASHLKGWSIADALDSNPESAKNMVELAVKVCLAVCKSYCELGVDLIVLAESVMPQMPTRYLSLASSALNPLVNVIRFYNCLPLLLANGCTSDSINLLTSMEVDGMVIDSSIEADVRQRVSHFIVGRAISSSVLEGPKDRLLAHVENCLKQDQRRVFISTEWQVPYDTPPENIHEIIRAIRRA